MKTEEQKLASMEQMQSFLPYLLKHLYEPFSLEDIASAYDFHPRYFEKIFREYYGCGLQKFMSGLRLRQAARVLLEGGSVKNQWGKYGYKSSSAFSSAFRKEFGMSPDTFKKRMSAVPYINVKKELFGTPVYMTFQDVPAFLIRGRVYPVDEDKTPYILENMDYALSHNLESVNLWTDSWYSILFYDYKSTVNEQGYQLYYLHGQDPLLKNEVKKEGDFYLHPFSGLPLTLTTDPVSLLSTPEEMPAYLEIEPEHYAIFSIPRCREQRKDLFSYRILLHYIFDEWILINSIKTNRMGWTFTRFSRDYIQVYVPLEKSSGSVNLEDDNDRRMENWISYIDAHIEEKLSTEDLAFHFGYSTRNFYDIFKLYYAVTPSDYIRKKRVCLAVNSLMHAEEKLFPYILHKYGFSDLEQLTAEHQKLFPQVPFMQQTVGASVVSLKDYFRQNIENLSMHYQESEPLRFTVLHQKATRDNIAEYTVYWLLSSNENSGGENQKDLTDQTPITQKPQDFIALWSAEGSEIHYVIGKVMDNETAPMSDEKSYTLQGGRYAVFEPLGNSGTGPLKEDYLLMTRCVFYGWVKENMFRFDGSRITFVRYCSGKLQFYVPVIY